MNRLIEKLISPLNAFAIFNSSFKTISGHPSFEILATYYLGLTKCSTSALTVFVSWVRLCQWVSNGSLPPFVFLNDDVVVQEVTSLYVLKKKFSLISVKALVT